MARGYLRVVNYAKTVRDMEKSTIDHKTMITMSRMTATPGRKKFSVRELLFEGASAAKVISPLINAVDKSLGEMDLQ